MCIRCTMNFRIATVLYVYTFIFTAAKKSSGGTITWDKNPSGDPKILTPSATENTPPGPLGIFIEASFSEGPATRGPAYRIINNADMFELSNSYELVLMPGYSLDYETKQRYVLVLKATDNSRPKTTSIVTCILPIVDINEAPVFSQHLYIFYVEQGDGENTSVGTVLATDEDSTSRGNIVTYRITEGNVGNTFTVDTVTGELSVDTGKIVSYNTTVFMLTVRATSSGDGKPFSTTIVSVLVTPVNQPLNEASRVTSEQTLYFILPVVFYVRCQFRR